MSRLFVQMQAPKHRRMEIYTTPEATATFSPTVLSTLTGPESKTNNTVTVGEQ